MKTKLTYNLNIVSAVKAVAVVAVANTDGCVIFNFKM